MVFSYKEARGPWPLSNESSLGEEKMKTRKDKKMVKLVFLFIFIFTRYLFLGIYI